MAKKAFVYDGTQWVDLAQSTTDLTNYANLTSNQPTFRNVFINGGFAIDQRNNGSALTSISSTLIYTVDRWYAFCTGIGVNISSQRIAGTAPNRYHLRLTAPGGSSQTTMGFGQRIEAANSFHMAGQTATLSASIASSSLTSITWTAYYANSTDSFGTVASPTRTQIATGTFTINSTLTRYSANISIPAAATTGLEIVFTTGIIGGSNTVTFAGAQLELGSVATPFEQRPIGTELALCQRYYIQLSPSGTQTIGFGHVQTGTTNRITVPLPVTMRAAPVFSKTATTFSTVGGGAQVFTVTSTFNVLPNGVVLEGTVPTANTSPLILFAAAGNVVFDAEL